MEISVRDKYRGNKTQTKNKPKSDVDFSLFMLQTICDYTVSENRNIRKSQLINN